MHDIEPFYLWQPLYQSNEDKRSPFYGRTYSEIYFDQKYTITLFIHSGITLEVKHFL
jgi:hypothetical protein